ncbi:SH3 domain-containing protein [Aureimonas sp. OT7]|nr:SH3 domain-containing protein [Aureimonas sp. OT7]
MGKAKSSIGWIAAGVFGLLWLGSGEKEPGSSAPRLRPVALEAPSGSAPLPEVGRTAPAQPVEGIRPAARTVAYATGRVRVRSGPTTADTVLATLSPGQQVEIVDARGAWRRIHTGRLQGWAHGDYLSETAPTQLVAPRPAQTRQPPVAPSALLGSDRAGQPRREPYVGTCDCPYDRMRNGRLCGRTSAYSKPGGRSPACYF